ncbi:MAG: hypothetical protein AABY32_01950 [Nanoarchaeota archaeon]
MPDITEIELSIEQLEAELLKRKLEKVQRFIDDNASMEKRIASLTQNIEFNKKAIAKFEQNIAFLTKAIAKNKTIIENATK